MRAIVPRPEDHPDYVRFMRGDTYDQAVGEVREAIDKRCLKIKLWQHWSLNRLPLNLSLPFQYTVIPSKGKNYVSLRRMERGKSSVDGEMHIDGICDLVAFRKKVGEPAWLYAYRNEDEALVDIERAKIEKGDNHGWNGRKAPLGPITIAENQIAFNIQASQGTVLATPHHQPQQLMFNRRLQIYAMNF